jgi:hypothetical protein
MTTPMWRHLLGRSSGRANAAIYIVNDLLAGSSKGDGVELESSYLTVCTSKAGDNQPGNDLVGALG